MPPIPSTFVESVAGKKVGGWKLGKLLGSGKSASVFRATKGNQVAAVKVFFPELVAKYGKVTQLRRIGREMTLKGKLHPNLVEIYDGGECSTTGYLYVVMKLVAKSNMASNLKKIPTTKISEIIKQLADAARFLERHNIAHRDIKPENVALSKNFESVTLLDLGVIFPFHEPDLTDIEARAFIGTLRYSPPEYLLRKEKKNPRGYRAITFYQLGAILHDLIMRRPLFEEHTQPFMALGEAIKTINPEIKGGADIDPYLVTLARNCLVKSPETRLKLVSWKDFESPKRPIPRAEIAKERVKTRGLIALSEQNPTDLKAFNPQQIIASSLETVESVVRLECAGNSAFPRFSIDSDAAKKHLILRFDSQPSISLHFPMGIRLSVATIDESTHAIALQAECHLLNDIDDKLPGGETTTIFLGSFDSENLRDSIKNALYICLDSAQEQVEEADSVTQISLELLKI